MVAKQQVSSEDKAPEEKASSDWILEWKARESGGQRALDWWSGLWGMICSLRPALPQALSSSACTTFRIGGRRKASGLLLSCQQGVLCVPARAQTWFP